DYTQAYSTWAGLGIIWQWLKEEPYSIRWVQFWGQMNPYNTPSDGSACCELEQDLHERYVADPQWPLPSDPHECCDTSNECCPEVFAPDSLYVHNGQVSYYDDIIQFLNLVTGDGCHGGFYSRPQPGVLDQTNLDWWRDWLDAEGGADDVSCND